MIFIITYTSCMFPLELAIKFLLLVFNSLNDTAPSYISDCLIIYLLNHLVLTFSIFNVWNFKQVVKQPFVFMHINHLEHHYTSVSILYVCVHSVHDFTLKCWATGKKLKRCDTNKIETFTFHPLTFSASEDSSKGFMQELSLSTHLPESASKCVCMKCGSKKEKCSHYSRQPRSLSGASHQLLTLAHVSRISLSLIVSIFYIWLSILLPPCAHHQCFWMSFLWNHCIYSITPDST